MTDIDLAQLDKDALVKLRKDVDKALADYDERRRQEAWAAAEAAARELGYSLNDLTGSAKGTKKAFPPKYRHPENPQKTWSGRGRQPAWIKQAADAGSDLSEFLIAG